MKFTQMKKDAIERKRRGSYEEVMRKLGEERVAMMGKGFRQYELVKGISKVLD